MANRIPSKHLWFSILNQEESELFIHSIVEEIIQRSQDLLFEKHISSQVLPYAVQFAKNVIVEMIEWEFFLQDTEDHNSPIWKPDDEPEPIPIDSWAPFTIPLKTLSPAERQKLLENAETYARNASKKIANNNEEPKRNSHKASRLSKTRRSTKINDSSSLSSLLDSRDRLIAEKTEENNKKALARIAEIERSGGKSEYTVDQDGRLYFIKIPRRMTMSMAGIKQQRTVPPNSTSNVKPSTTQRSSKSLTVIKQKEKTSPVKLRTTDAPKTSPSTSSRDRYPKSTTSGEYLRNINAPRTYRRVDQQTENSVTLPPIDKRKSRFGSYDLGDEAKPNSTTKKVQS
ncbi:hypothetical protein BKA69DRAFT_1128678 [Paraphysoderma sedebokerense]|nr:hypothetical protein BKA69DRAFT_1128678 [Paraphysoderma sedebokerense]